MAWLVAAHPPGNRAGAVLDGRDIGTVVCPDAPVKIFLTASLDVRATRRFNELRAGDPTVIYGRVRRDLLARDARDRSRDVAPLVPAPDARVIDTGGMDSDAVFADAMAFIEKARS